MQESPKMLVHKPLRGVVSKFDLPLCYLGAVVNPEQGTGNVHL